MLVKTTDLFSVAIRLPTHCVERMRARTVIEQNAMGKRNLLKFFSKGVQGRLPAHKLMPMPRLSPSMTRGKLVRWNINEGQPLPESGMDTICDVQPSNLTMDSEDGNSHILEIECHEEGFLARILLPEGSEVEPDEAIAVICENESDIELVYHAYSPTEISSSRLIVPPATFAWQAFLSSKSMSVQSK